MVIAVEKDQQPFAVIPPVGSLDLPHPQNPLAFGGRISNFEPLDQILVTDPDGNQEAAQLAYRESLQVEFTYPDPLTDTVVATLLTLTRV